MGMAKELKLDWRAVQSFLNVARARKLTTAAKLLGVDHSTLSHRIRSVEQALKVTLFERRTTGYVLTPDGEALFEAAKRMERDLWSASSRLSERGGAINGTLKIGAGDGFTTHFLMPRLQAFCHLHPHLNIQVHTTSSPLSLANRDVHVWIAPHCPNEGRLHVRKLAEYELGLYGSVAYLANSPRIRKVEDLKQHYFIGFPSELVYSTNLDFASMFIEQANMPITSSSLSVQVAAAASGAGLVFLPNYLANQHSELVSVLPDNVSIERSNWLVVHSDTKDLAMVKAFNQHVIEEVRIHRHFFMPRRYSMTTYASG